MKRKFHCYPSWNITWKHSFSVAQHSSCKREHPERICNYVYRKLVLWKLHRYNLVTFLHFNFQLGSNDIFQWNFDFSIPYNGTYIWIPRLSVYIMMTIVVFLFKAKTVSFERRLKNKEKLKLQKKVKMKEVTKRITT